MKKRSEAERAAIKKIKNQKDAIIKTLKDVNKYSKELNYQIDIFSRLYLLFKKITEEVLDDEYSIVYEEKSREGNVRKKIDPLARLPFEQASPLMKLLKGLKMNMELTKPDDGGSRVSSPLDKLIESINNLNEEGDE
ncbi:hypothetical protein [Phocaeicola faecalis]